MKKNTLYFAMPALLIIASGCAQTDRTTQPPDSSARDATTPTPSVKSTPHPVVTSTPTPVKTPLPTPYRKIIDLN